MREVQADLEPTFENVVQEFVAGTMDDLLFSNRDVNFKFDFREKEALDFIEEQLNKYADGNVAVIENNKKIMKALQEKTDNNEDMPVMVVHDYKKFFEYLRQIYEKNIDLFFERTNDEFFPKYELRNCFLDIWLRATPADFNDPELFLEKQAKMLNDTTFSKFDDETVLGEVSFFDDIVISVKNSIARTWDEAYSQMEIMLYDKDRFERKNDEYVPRYILPVIRYGIYEKDGRKVCHIGSIQNINFKTEKDAVSRKVDRKKYSINSEVPDEYKDGVEPKNVVALSIFMAMLNKEGITDIEIPSMYVLDYEYHEKRNRNLIDRFNEKWTDELQQSEPVWYEIEKASLEKSCGSPDLISEIKTERLIKNLERVLFHFPNGRITSFPDDADNYLHINIPTVTDKGDIRGDAVREIFQLVGKQYEQLENAEKLER